MMRRSNLDNRMYTAFVLENLIRVFWITDPKTPISSAALSVGVGSFSDPDTHLGLAHFLEHMLFMGSKKYPSENVFTDYLTRFGGSTNAYTEDDTTVYYFDVSNKGFKRTLDMFLHHFVDPLLNPDSVDREISAVQSEFDRGLFINSCRLERMNQICCRKDTNESRFQIGNKDTLKGELCSPLFDFWNKYYNAESMCLVIYSNHSAELCKSFIDSASLIPSSFSKIQKNLGQLSMKDQNNIECSNYVSYSKYDTNNHIECSNTPLISSHIEVRGKSEDQACLGSISKNPQINEKTQNEDEECSGIENLDDDDLDKENFVESDSSSNQNVIQNPSLIEYKHTQNDLEKETSSLLKKIKDFQNNTSVLSNDKIRCSHGIQPEKLIESIKMASDSNKSGLLDFLKVNTLYNENFTNKIIHVKSINNQKKLMVQIIVPSEYRLYLTNPYGYYIYLLNEEGENGLVFKLKQRKFAFGLDVETISNKMYTRLIIKVYLTDLGAVNLKSVSDLIKEYLMSIVLSESCYSKISAINKIEFAYSDLVDRLDLVADIAQNMQFLPVEKVLEYDYLYEIPDAGLFSFLRSLFSDCSRYLWFYTSPDGEYDQKEDIYDVDFRIGMRVCEL